MMEAEKKAMEKAAKNLFGARMSEDVRRWRIGELDNAKLKMAVDLSLSKYADSLTGINEAVSSPAQPPTTPPTVTAPANK